MFSPVSLSQHGFLYVQLVRRDIERRYKATAGGLFWAIIQPVLMIGIYTIVFGLIFRPRWPATDSPWDYVLILFLGKIPYLLMTETLSQSSNTIAGHSNLVKRAVFPLQLLPAVSLGSSLYHALMAIAIWVVLFIVLRQQLPLGVLLLPLLWMPLLMFTLGLSWLVAALGGYFRDIVQIVAFVNVALMFLSPIFYPVSAAPGLLGEVMQFNPLTLAIESSRNMLLFGQPVSMSAYAMHTVIGLVMLALGLGLFRRVRPGFADVV